MPGKVTATFCPYFGMYVGPNVRCEVILHGMLLQLHLEELELSVTPLNELNRMKMVNEKHDNTLVKHKPTLCIITIL